MKIGFTCGTFDLLHAGHVLMLQEAKSVCDYLIVGLQTDPTIDRPKKNKPIQSLEERKIVLEAIRYVDSVIVYSTEVELYELLQKLNINIRIIGADWKEKEFTGKDLNIPIFYNSRDHNYSSSSLRQTVFWKEFRAQGYSVID